MDNPTPSIEPLPIEKQRELLAPLWQERAANLQRIRGHWKEALSGHTPDGLPARDLLHKVAAEDALARAERRWVNAILEHSGNVGVSYPWNKERNDYDCLLGNGLRFEAIDTSAGAAAAGPKSTP